MYMSVLYYLLQGQNSFINPLLQWYVIQTSGLFAFDLEA